MMKTLLLVMAASVLANGLAHADAKRGEKLFEECRACHTLEPNASSVGPDLHGVIGRKAASREDFRYSPALKKSGITWSRQSLDAYIADPQKAVPANRMPYGGMPEAKDRADLIDYVEAAFK
jgi:cytochrome c